MQNQKELLAQQLGAAFHLHHKHISTIAIGDIVLNGDTFKTVCKKDLGKCNFIGKTVFGDSYHLGTKKVIVAVYAPL
jgi:hypothetical protein